MANFEDPLLQITERKTPVTCNRHRWMKWMRPCPKVPWKGASRQQTEVSKFIIQLPMPPISVDDARRRTWFLYLCSVFARQKELFTSYLPLKSVPVGSRLFELLRSENLAVPVGFPLFELIRLGKNQEYHVCIIFDLYDLPSDKLQEVTHLILECARAAKIDQQSPKNLFVVLGGEKHDQWQQIGPPIRECDGSQWSAQEVNAVFKSISDFRQHLLPISKYVCGAPLSPEINKEKSEEEQPPAEIKETKEMKEMKREEEDRQEGQEQMEGKEDKKKEQGETKTKTEEEEERHCARGENKEVGERSKIREANKGTEAYLRKTRQDESDFPWKPFFQEKILEQISPDQKLVVPAEVYKALDPLVSQSRDWLQTSPFFEAFGKTLKNFKGDKGAVSLKIKPPKYLQGLVNTHVFVTLDLTINQVVSPEILKQLEQKRIRDKEEWTKQREEERIKDKEEWTKKREEERTRDIQAWTMQREEEKRREKEEWNKRIQELERRFCDRNTKANTRAKSPRQERSNPKLQEKRDTKPKEKGTKRIRESEKDQNRKEKTQQKKQKKRKQDKPEKSKSKAKNKNVLKPKVSVHDAKAEFPLEEVRKLLIQNGVHRNGNPWYEAKRNRLRWYGYQRKTKCAIWCPENLELEWKEKFDSLKNETLGGKERLKEVS